MAHVTAKLGQRNEHLPRIGNLPAMREIAPRGSGLQQRAKITQIC
jgi:hypothetical protein